jgi:hypothetical protein
MKGTFPQSRELKEIIEWYDWTLYDVTRPPKVAFKWEEMEHQAPAEGYEIGHDYLFVPIPKEGQTPREAYTPTKGLGPSLLIEDPKDERWDRLYIDRRSFEQGRPILFTRLLFEEPCAVAMSPKTAFVPDPDSIGIKYDHLVDTFRRYFRIVLPQEYGLTAPIPTPPIH